MHLQPILEFVYEYLRPGTLTLALAVVAAVTALPGVAKAIEHRWWLHVIAILVFFSIAGAEGMVIRHASKMDEERVNGLVATTAGIQATLTGYIQAQAIASQAQAERKSRHKVSDELLQLKSRSAGLAADIFNLLLQRSEMFTGNIMFSRNRPSTPQEAIATEIPYDEQTVLLYQQKYGALTRQAVQDLAAHGLRDETLEMFAASPNNMIAVRAIANHLAAQAERITPDGIKPATRLLTP